MRLMRGFVGLVCLSALAVASDFAAVRDAYLAKYKPIWMEASAAWWAANISGSDADYDRKKAADKAMVALQSDKALFAKVKELHESGKISDPLEKRELDVMYRSLLPAQADKALQDKIVDLGNEVEQIFNTHRSAVNGKELSENDVREILSKSANSAECEAAWKGYMAVGVKADGKLRELVKLRNELATQLGFKNFYQMQLGLQEIDEADLLKLLDNLEKQMQPALKARKGEIDAARAKRFGVAAKDLRPWHFGDLFFQEAPLEDEVNLDDLYAKVDLQEMCRKYYAGMGLPCDDILARSDLYEKKGKDPHAFCTDLNRAGDIRLLCNLKPNLYWSDTIIHEAGHGVYAKYIASDVPFLLHEESHALTTEGIAQMFGAAIDHEQWLREALKLDDATIAKYAPVARRNLRTHWLLFAAWTQVMVRFEQSMYSNPNQDLGKLWWELKQRYQLLNPPETTNRPDYAAKVHILSTPAYYHSYLLGELFAAQVRSYANTKILGLPKWDSTCFYNQPKAGAYFKDKVFAPGDRMSWKELTKYATGEEMDPKYFVAQLD